MDAVVEAETSVVGIKEVASVEVRHRGGEEALLGRAMHQAIWVEAADLEVELPLLKIRLYGCISFSS